VTRCGESRVNLSDLKFFGLERESWWQRQNIEAWKEREFQKSMCRDIGSSFAFYVLPSHLVCLSGAFHTKLKRKEVQHNAIEKGRLAELNTSAVLTEYLTNCRSPRTMSQIIMTCANLNVASFCMDLATICDRFCTNGLGPAQVSSQFFQMYRAKIRCAFPCVV